MRIRFATAEDAGTILEFIRDLAAYENEPDAVEASEELLAAQLSEAVPPFESLIAELGGAPVGFALFFHTYSTWRAARGIHLEDLWVAPHARRRGIGKALLARLAAIACERGCARLEWTVLDWSRAETVPELSEGELSGTTMRDGVNELGMRFYRAIGARPLGEWTIWRLSDEPLRALAAQDRR